MQKRPCRPNAKKSPTPKHKEVPTAQMQKNPHCPNAQKKAPTAKKKSPLPKSKKAPSFQMQKSAPTDQIKKKIPTVHMQISPHRPNVKKRPPPKC
jgi:hypothetical protein